ncbi:N-acetylmuramoyl-L-alanine amidase [Helicobacter baculiformis]|uniref:N-acetylmuramoyl-L-alanine amidase n=1 Tax=Helicobacter baculiformis TaxID=427351 RepID=A0ABV7ZH13_9HELI|nr:N-acetylmuramoyl-L-alanine amidase [Helicobacter baculiformis]
MRDIQQIIIHCSATKEGKDFRAADIDRWHKERGFKQIGYHYVITLEGCIERGRDLAEVGAHCKGHNAHSIGICYIGGLDLQNKPKDTRTPAQKRALEDLLTRLRQAYPQARVYGHRDFEPKKECPCFCAQSAYE